MANPLPDHGSSRGMLREDLNLSVIFRVLWFHKTILLSVTIIFGVVALLFAANQEKTYKATALIEIRPTAMRIINFEDQAREKADIETHIEDSLVQLGAADFLKPVVDDLNLIVDPEFSVRTDKQMASKAPAKDSATESSNTALRSAIALLQERLIVRRVGNANVIAIDVVTSRSAKSARIANSLAEAYLTSQVTNKEHKMGEAIRWIEHQIASVRGELIGIEGQIIEQMVKKQIHHANGENSLALRTSTLVGELAAAKSATVHAMERLNNLRQQKNSGKALYISNAALSELRATEVLMQRRLAELAKEYGPRHPLLITLERDLSGIRARIQEEGDRVLIDQRHEVAVMQARESELEKQLDALKTHSIDEQHAMLDIGDLQHRAAAEKTRLVQFLERRRNLLEERQLLEADGQIMSHASARTSPSSPKPWITSFFAACTGLLLSGAWVFLADRWVSDFGFKSLEELRDYDLVPLGIVPNLTRREGRGAEIEDYIISQRFSSQAEAFRRLRTRLCKTDDASTSGIGSVMITSSLPLEGKTATAIALARQAAESGMSTLLVDADLRRPRIHDVIGVDHRRGLSDLLAGSDRLEDSIAVDSLTPLHFMPAGNCCRNPTEFLRSERLRSLFATLEESYDWIIIDTPPIGAVSDCLLLGQHAGKTIYVARWRSTNRSTILSGVQELETAGIQVDGVILSRVHGNEQPKYGDVDFGQYYGHYQNRHLAS